MDKSSIPSDRTIAQGAIIQERYQLLREIGQGGMGIVYEATDLLLERNVAVKILSKTDSTGDQRQLLLSEAKAAAKLNHPHVVSVYDAGESGGVPFIVLELIEGHTLREVGQPSLEDVALLAADICSALEHAHENGIIHRDLKPDNIMITKSGQLVLMDFGLARISGRSLMTIEEGLAGTVNYLAPELIIGQPASERSDLYALGVILYDLTTGRPPFEGENLAVLLSNQLHAPVTPPSAHNPSISYQFDSLIIQLLEKEPSNRPQSASEVKELLAVIADPMLAGLPVASESPVTSLLGRIASGRLVGRDEELAQATTLWLRTLSGQAGLLLVSGEPGIGKTRLSQAIIAHARIGGAAVFRGGCYEFEAMTPYLPISEALREWVRIQDLDSMRNDLGETATELARLAPEIDSKLGPLPENPSLGPDEQRLRLFENIALFIEKKAANAGLLLFVDDLHWADKGSLSLLTYLMRRLRDTPFLVVAAYREVELDRKHPLADALVQWNRQRVAIRIPLSRFSLKKTKTMIVTLFRMETVSEDFARVIHRETDGNPFFIEEVIKALVEQGQVYWSEDHWDRQEIDQLTIPQSIKEAIGRRLNSLTEVCIETLHTAAVIGKDFAFSLLNAVSGDDEAQLLDALDEARKAQLIRQLGAESFVFTHDKIREVLYEEILTIRRSRLHLRIAQSLEETDGGQTTTPIEDLAYHYIAAGILDKGMDYAIQAATKAQQLFAGDEAIEYLRQALECAVSLDDIPAQAAIHEHMGDAFASIGPFDASVDHYRQAASLSSDRRVAINVKIGLVFNTTNNEEGVPILEEALRVLDPVHDPVTVARALSALGRFYHYRCEYSAAIELFEQARELAEPIGDIPSLTFIYAYLAGAYQHLAQFDLSMEWADRAINIGERNNYLFSVAVGYEFKAENNLIMGYWNRALEAAHMDQNTGKQAGSAAREAWGSWCAGYASYGLGDLAKAVSIIEDATEQAITIGEKRLEIFGYIVLSLSFADMGDDRALDFAELAIEGSSKMVELFQLGFSYQVKGYACLRLGQLENALKASEKSRDLLEDTEQRDITLYRLPCQAEALLLSGNSVAAADLLSASLDLSRDVGAPRYEAVTRRVIGLLNLELGDLNGAMDELNRAIELAESIGSRVELGRTYYAKALVNNQVGDFAAAGLDASMAESLFSECGASRELDKTQLFIATLHKNM